MVTDENLLYTYIKYIKKWESYLHQSVFMHLGFSIDLNKATLLEGRTNQHVFFYISWSYYTFPVFQPLYSSNYSCAFLSSLIVDYISHFALK